MVEDFFTKTWTLNREKIDETATDPSKSISLVEIGSYKGYLQYKSSSVNYPNQKKTIFTDYILVCQRDLDMRLDDIIISDGKRFRLVLLALMSIDSMTFSMDFDRYGLLYLGNVG